MIFTCHTRDQEDPLFEKGKSKSKQLKGRQNVCPKSKKGRDEKMQFSKNKRQSL